MAMRTREQTASEFPFFNSLCIGNLTFKSPRDGGMLCYGEESSFRTGNYYFSDLRGFATGVHTSGQS